MKLIHGSAHDIPIPDASVQCVVTSPPYWGLRAYAGEQAIEWPSVSYAPMPGLPECNIPGCEPGCAHEWGDYVVQPKHSDDGVTGSTLGGGKATQAQAQRQPIAGAYCRKCGGWRGGLGLEPTPEMYIGHLILCLREWRRVLRDDGVVMINLGDSYFGGGAQRAGAYGTFGKAPEDCLGHGCSSENPCDACQRRARRTSRKGSRNDPTQAVSPSAPNHAHTASERGHLPTSDSVRPADHNADAILHQQPRLDHADEQPRAVLESTTNESSLPHPEDSRRSATSSSFPSAAGSLPASIRESARRTASRSESQTSDAAIQDRHSDTQCSAATGDASDDHISGTASDSFSYPYFNTTPRHGQAGLKPKDLCGIPWRLAFAAQADGWWLRSDIIWAKPNPMPESVTDRPTRAHEYVFLLAKSQRYYWDADAVREEHKRLWDSNNGGSMAKTELADAAVNGQGHQGWNHKGNYPLPNPAGRNLRSVWTIATQPTPFAHFATFPEKLVEPCIKAGSRVGDTVLDPFNGSGTTGKVAVRLGREYVGVDISETYLKEVTPLRFASGVQVEMAL